MHLWCNSDSIAQLNAKIIGKPVAEHLGLTPILSERRDRDPANQLKVSLFLHQGGKDAMCTGGGGVTLHQVMCTKNRASVLQKQGHIGGWRRGNVGAQ